MDMTKQQQPMPGQDMMTDDQGEQPSGIRSVTIILTEDGRYSVGESQYPTIDAALQAAKRELSKTDEDDDADRAFQAEFDTGTEVEPTKIKTRY